MSDKPVPLREALRDAVAELMDACLYDDEHDNERDRVVALIEQIPIVFEAREGHDDTA